MPVVNRHHLRNPWPAKAIYVGRPGRLATGILKQQPHVQDGTALGNPFRPQNFSVPDDCLQQYRWWLQCRMNLKRQRGRWVLVPGGDAAVLAALRLIETETTIICSCKPKPCHGDVVERAAAWLRGHGSATPA